MAKITDVNNNGINGSAAIFRLKAVLKAAGWTVTQSSDGTTYNASGDQISIEGAGAGGMENTNAWFEIQDPAGGRELSIQRGTTNVAWRIKYSALDTFSAGSPGATQVGATAGGPGDDEQILHGAGTDASPTFSTLFASASTFYWHVIAQDAATGPVGNESYPFWAFATHDGSGEIRTTIFCEVMDPDSYPALVGTRAAPTTGDPDPVVLCVQYDSSGGGIFKLSQGATNGWCETTATNKKKYWFQYNNTNSGAEAFVQGHGGGTILGDNSPTVTLSRNFPSNPYDGSDQVLQFLLARTGAAYTTQLGLKGYPMFMRSRTISGRAYPDTLSLATDAYVYVEDTLIPWEDNTTPIV